MLFQSAWAGPNLELQSGPGRLGDLAWRSLSFDFSPAVSDELRDWRLQMQGLHFGIEQLPVADLSVRCSRFKWTDSGTECGAAELRLAFEGHAPIDLQGLSWLTSAEGSVHGRWAGDGGLAALTWSGGTLDPVLELSLSELDLGALSADWLEPLGLQLLGGVLAAELMLVDGLLTVSAAWTDGLLDGFEGRFAAENVAADLDLELGVVSADGNGEISGRLALRQSAGELLIDSLYLPPPELPLSIELDWTLKPLEFLRLSRLSLDDPGSLRATARAELVATEQGWRLHAVDVLALDASLGALWPRWLDGPASAAGFGGLELDGSVTGEFSWRADPGMLTAADLRVRDFSLLDPRERLAVFGLQAELLGSQGSLESDLAWDQARLWGLPLGALGLSMYADDRGWRLLEPLRVPVLDGFVIFDSLAWLNLPELPSQWVLDARIEPISLGLLTRELGLLELGGTLAGRFPGVEYQDERLSFTGGIVIDAFSGRIAVDDLQIERPFGTLPAVAAQIEFQRLDLLDLTGAFDFGRMEGQLSGWMRDLRLLDWRPVAMDTRLFTHEDAPRRRISQRAVDNLSSLGGAGGGFLSGTALRFFEDFPYRRAGIACRLSNNICYIDGVAPHDSGGFLIVEGRGLPRLDVVGHRRLVDWPQLVRQLEAMRQQNES